MASARQVVKPGNPTMTINKTPDKVIALAKKIERKLTEQFANTEFAISYGWRYNTEIKIRWSNGPSEKEVKEIIGKYERGYDIQRETFVDTPVKYFQVDLIDARRI